MKVKKYLVNRILELERNLKQAENEQAEAKHGFQKLQEEIIMLNEKLEQYQIECEHIKEIITCNIGRNAYNHLALNIDLGDNDFKTLLAILDIKPEDYRKENNNAKTKD